PFASKEEWEMAVWLIQNVGHNKIEEFLKLAMVCAAHHENSQCAGSKYKFLQQIDSLPVTDGMKWTYKEVKVVSNLLDEDGKAMTEKLELWHHNPVECIRELIGNPASEEHMSYAPEQVYADDEGLVRIFDKM
ncbi:hypothetical protein BC835DRAFT_1207867, partial [Cytidiella melzeri]